MRWKPLTERPVAGPEMRQPPSRPRSTRHIKDILPEMAALVHAGSAQRWGWASAVRRGGSAGHCWRGFLVGESGEAFQAAVRPRPPAVLGRLAAEAARSTI